MKPCCSKPHAWDFYEVAVRWKPDRLRYVIVGENPSDEMSMYFYQPADGRDPVHVRSHLLHGLTAAGLISGPTLQAFRTAGFLFDHAIRCHMPLEEIESWRHSADRPVTVMPGGAEHLRPLLIEAQIVWVMGRIARKAVATVADEFPFDRQPISKPPHPCRVKGTKYFVSRNLSRMSQNDADRICRALRDSFPELVTTIVTRKAPLLSDQSN